MVPRWAHRNMYLQLIQTSFLPNCLNQQQHIVLFSVKLSENNNTCSYRVFCVIKLSVNITLPKVLIAKSFVSERQCLHKDKNWQCLLEFAWQCMELTESVGEIKGQLNHGFSQLIFFQSLFTFYTVHNIIIRQSI